MSQNNKVIAEIERLLTQIEEAQAAAQRVVIEKTQREAAAVSAVLVRVRSIEKKIGDK